MWHHNPRFMFTNIKFTYVPQLIFSEKKNMIFDERWFSIFFRGKIVAIILFCPRLIAFWKLGTESVMMTFVNLMLLRYQQNLIFDTLQTLLFSRQLVGLWNNIGVRGFWVLFWLRGVLWYDCIIIYFEQQWYTCRYLDQCYPYLCYAIYHTLDLT